MMMYSNSIIIIIILILNNLKTASGRAILFVVNEDGNKDCTTLCIAIFSLLGVALAVAISFCFYCYNKRVEKKEKSSSSPSNVMITDDLNNLEQPTLLSYDSQPPAYSELSNQPPPPPTLVHSESFNDAEEFFKNNQTHDSLPSNDIIQELLEQDTYSSWKFIPEKVLEQLEIVSITDDERGLIINSPKKKGLKYNGVMVQSNLPFFDPEKFVSERRDVEEKTKENLVGELHYFEITIAEKSDLTKIAIGLTTKPYPYYRMPGYNKYSIGYQDNGYKYQDSQLNSQEYGPKWGEIGDTIGCGYNPSLGEMFFTKDGGYLDVAHLCGEEQHVWYPTIGVEGTCKLEINFGDSHTMFKYKQARSFGPGAQGGWLYKHLDPSKKWAEE